MNDDNRPRGFAHVEFESPQDAANAIAQLNGKDLDGRNVRLDLSRQRGC
jgi:RNA recognition motif-containing protein